MTELKHEDLPPVPKKLDHHGVKAVLDQEDKIEYAYRTRSSSDFMTFVRGLKIDSQFGPQVFERCIAPFQRDCFEDLAPNLHALREGKKPKDRRWWIERTKKASKDADLAIVCLWLVAFPHRPFYAQIGAANKEQASIIKERMANLLHWNPWLNEHVEIVQWEVRSKHRMTGGQPLAHIHIMSSDIAGAHGGTPDLLIINELSHVTKWEFVENLMDNAEGVAQGMVIIATNAGFKGTKAEVWRNNAISSDSWKVHCWAKPAPWHSLEAIRDAKARNPHSRFRRLWWGIWASGKGDALSEEDIERCFTFNEPILLPEPGWLYVGGLDLGVSHDHSGLVSLGINERLQKLKLVQWRAWVPGVNSEVDLMSVEDACYQMHLTYGFQFLFYDPDQAKLMAQRLIRKGVPMKQMTFSSYSNLTAMANSLIQVVEAGKLEMYDDPDYRMRRDLGKFDLVEKSYGFRLEAVSDEFGHADVGTALVITLPFAVDCLAGSAGLRQEDSVAIEEDEELSEKEIEELPAEMREIIDGEEGGSRRTKKKLDPYEGVMEGWF